ncbi:Rhodanese-like domain-containing protein [Melampsora americana]|nr:Rhodanese-like domain-containing protein [Melampsora americana]
MASSQPIEWDGSDIKYEELKPITLTCSKDILLIDVREPEEVAQGSIPTSVNLPLSSLENSFGATPDEFLKLHGFPKPKEDQKMIFYCKSGKRSGQAADLVEMKGYQKIRVYKGSWIDWVKHEGSPSKSGLSKWILRHFSI